MKNFLFALIIYFLISFNNELISRSWCKAVYKQNSLPGELQEQISKCKNSDNFFLAIHTSFKNAGHLLNSFIAEYCDLNRNLHISEPRPGDPFFTIVCEFRKHYIRE
jgi:hypothetical protein